MDIVGKCPPEPDDLAQARRDGFDAVELYLTTAHLDAFDESVAACHAADVDIASVHTPHVGHDGFDYIQLADQLAVELDAYLVVHSMGFHLTNLNVLDEAVTFESEHGFESHPGNNLFFIENALLSTGRDFVLDVAHFYASEREYLDGIEYLLREYGESISVIHFCDGTRAKDGLAVGDGDIDMEAVCRLISAEFDGTVVIEVMPNHQEDGRRFFENIV